MVEHGCLLAVIKVELWQICLSRLITHVDAVFRGLIRRKIQVWDVGLMAVILSAHDPALTEKQTALRIGLDSLLHHLV